MKKKTSNVYEKFQGIPWNSMGFHGIQWNSMEISMEFSINI
jgi:hypothetical protein